MVEFIVQYWLQFLLGIIASGLTILCTRLYYLWKKERKEQRRKVEDRIVSAVKVLIEDNDKEIMKIIRQEEIASAEADKIIESKMNQIQKDLAILTEGMLSIQGRQFKDDCRKLLKEDHIISLDEYENITHEYNVYKQLDGNHEGDSLFGLVQVKYQANLSHV